MPGIGIVTNPRSRHNLRDPERMRTLGYILGNRGSCVPTKNLDDLYRVAEEFRHEKIDILGINGGDGTIHTVLTAFIKTYGAHGEPLPKVAILRGGTMNTIANSCGLKTPAGKALLELVERYHAGGDFTTVSRQTMQIGDQYGFIFGNGLIYNFLETYYEGGNASPWKAFKVVSKGVLSSFVNGTLSQRLFRRARGMVHVDGQVWDRDDFTSIACGTVNQIGLGFTPFYRAYENPGTFVALGIHCSPLSFCGELPRLWLGKPMRRDKVIDAVASEMVIESDGTHGYTIDGDAFDGVPELRITAGPAIKLIVI
jgi:diacylglycerol kinase family enzyme